MTVTVAGCVHWYCCFKLYHLMYCDRDVEDSLDSLLEDAGLEGTGSEDGMGDMLYCAIVFL